MTSNERNTGSDDPGSGTNRPSGTVDEDANPPLSDLDDDTTANSETGNLPPQDTGSAVPPYEGRQTGAQPDDQVEQTQ